MRESAGRAVAWGLLAAILISSLTLKLSHLGHRAIRGLDEVFHAIVARNLMKHPLTPALYERQYLPYDAIDWQNTTVWMHKPPLPLWQIATSFATFGQTPLALRLPSALLATGAVWLTYLIGAALFNRRVGLIAAGLHAFNPATFTLVHGYIFSDHVDIAMLFWTELGIFFVVRAMRGMHVTRDILLAGAAQGFALLSKTYPALIITGLAVVAWLLSRRERGRIRFHHVIVLAATSLIVIAPWTTWCLIKFRREFVTEQVMIVRHLHADVENWAAPWDRLIFDYLGRSFHVFYPMVLASLVLLAWRAWRERDARITMLIAWLLGVVIPHVIATSKTPSAALIGWPAGWLLIGCAIDRALRGDALLLGAWFGAGLAGVLWPGAFPDRGIGFPDPPIFAGVLRQNLWYAGHALVALSAAAIFAALWARSSPRERRLLALALTCIALAATVGLGGKYAYIAWRVTQLDRNEPSYAEIGRFVRSELPANAVMLVSETQKLEHKTVMFWTDRSSYPLSEPLVQLAARVRRAGGEPYLISPERLPFAVLFRGPQDRRTLYRIE